MKMLATRNGKSGFEDSFGSINSTVVVGGRDLSNNEFIPSMNCSAHGDEFWWNMFLLGTTPVAKPDPVGGVVEAPINGTLQRFYKRPDGCLEWEIVFESQPASNVLEFRLRHSGNLEFHKQLVSPERLAAGDMYEYPEAEGSYAVYSNKRHNRYQTGKVGHIRRFWVRDNNNNFAWVDIEVFTISRDESVLIATLPDSFMRNASYPVLLGPTIGYNTVGSLLGAIGTLASYYGPESVAASGGTITSIHIAVGTVAAPEGVKVGIANCVQSAPYNPSGKSLIASASDTLTGNSDDFTVGSLNAIAPVVAGTYYMYGLAFEFNNAARIKYDVFGSQMQSYYSKNFSLEMRDPVPSTSQYSGNAHISLWAEYAEDAGGGIKRACERGVERGIMRGVC